jgi:hypothetical protein
VKTPRNSVFLDAVVPVFCKQTIKHLTISRCVDEWMKYEMKAFKDACWRAAIPAGDADDERHRRLVDGQSHIRGRLRCARCDALRGACAGAAGCRSMADTSTTQR